MSRRQDIRQVLLDYFSTLEEDTSVEDCLNYYIVKRELGRKYQLKKAEIKTSSSTSTKERVRLRDQVSQELNTLKQKGLVKRRRYGVYYL
jgi:hypothetical protein